MWCHLLKSLYRGCGIKLQEREFIAQVRAGLQGHWELVVSSDCSAEDSKRYAFKIAVDDMLDKLMTPRILGAPLSQYTEVSVYGLSHKQEKNLVAKKIIDLKRPLVLFYCFKLEQELKIKWYFSVLGFENISIKCMDFGCMFFKKGAFTKI